MDTSHSETTSHSKEYSLVEFPSEIGIVFGNEALGVSPEVLEICDDLIEIPMYGFKNSMNVATSAAVIGFRAIEMMEKMGILRS